MSLKRIARLTKRRDAAEYLDDTFDDVVQEAIDFSKQQGKEISAEEIQQLQLLRNQLHFFHNQWLRSFLESLDGDGYRAMMHKNLVIGGIKNSHQQAFVIGDNPVIQAFPGGSTLPDERAEVIMPIASKAKIVTLLEALREVYDEL